MFQNRYPPNRLERFIDYACLLAVLAFMAWLLTGCSTEKRLQKAINLNGQKESIDYIFSHYPQYIPYKDTTIVVEIPPRLVPVPGDSALVTVDSAALDSFLYENGWLKLEIHKWQNKYRILADKKPDTVKVPATRVNVPTSNKPVVVPCPECPDCKTSRSGLKSFLDGLGAVWDHWLAIALTALLLFAVLWVIRFKRKRSA